MKKVYLKNSTKIEISRSIRNSHDPGQTFVTTYGDALKENDFTTCSGTVHVDYHLHDSEYKNFGMCLQPIFRDSKGLYLEKPQFITPGQAYYKEGVLREDGDFGESDKIYKPNIGWVEI